MPDNRDYRYTLKSFARRQEYPVIISWVKNGCNVIDLGSGDGSLLTMLRDRKDVIGVGIEISSSGVESAKKKGIKSVAGRIDEKLPFKNKEFDFAICNVTLQMVMYPEVVLNEMKRISRYQIISFPNFAFFRNRISLLIRGRMPRDMIPGYTWYSTGHIHQLSIADFTDFCKENDMSIVKSKFFFDEDYKLVPLFIQRKFPKLFASEAIFMTK